jgi:GT2 family glycosyltransferase
MQTLTQLSVLVPVRNGAKFIKPCLKSILTWLPKQSEVIVVNDASTDETGQLVDSFTDSRIVHLRLEESKGIAQALNFGLYHSKGLFIARMDADDICLPWRFALQLQKLRANSALDFVFTTAIVFGQPIKPYPFLPQLPLPLNDGQFKLALLEWNPAVHPTMMARKEALLSLDGYRDVPAEDLDLWIRAALEGYTFQRVCFPSIFLRLHESQITRQDSWKIAIASNREIGALRNALREKLGVEKTARGLGFLSPLFSLEKNGLPRFLAPWKSRE